MAWLRRDYRPDRLRHRRRQRADARRQPFRGTWEGTEDQITLHLSSKDITLKVVDKNTLEGNAADFGIADFDTINFDFYG